MVTRQNVSKPQEMLQNRNKNRIKGHIMPQTQPDWTFLRIFTPANTKHCTE
jgi:hypothetical protein